MRIGIVCPYNYFLPGGVQEHVKAQAKLLETHGHYVRVITPRPWSYNEVPPKDVIFLGQSVRVRAPHATTGVVSVSVDIDDIDSILAAERFDIVHVHEPLVPFLARQLLTRATCFRVGTFHAALPGNVLGKSFTGSFKTYARSVLPYIDVITAVSPASVGYIEDFNEHPINYIPNGINFSHFRGSRQLTRDKNSILFIGRLEKRKGARMLLEAFRIVKSHNPAARLFIAGHGPQRRSLENYCRDNDIDDVQFLGFISDDEKKQLLQTCQVFCSPALYGESFGVVLLEAMALGAPIVAHSNPGYEWVLQETGRLSLVNVTDTEEFARRLCLLMEDEHLRKVWQKWATAYVKQFSYQRIVGQYEKLYAEVLGRE